VGNFGTVWKGHCFDPSSAFHMKTVAIKILNLEWFSRNEELVEFRREISIMSQNYHPNVMSNYADFVTENELWVVMPLMKAGSLENIIGSFE
jgi:serine/threonine protein kinase